ncbi:MAG: DUF3800 domain-containing protein [Actinomyces ruminicola]|uniref:DUF3800 domain-containing protein n=1 Tax=Actinomyces ruminicola TaxID=332524 RepID=A0A1G9S6M4_9ACTO|nr:DUF3800 domain-containing protein [Actinomyces ruminicola]MBE6482016.1 DUF3800 domain-containing protein [Actinomyces ruminicola]SDM31168.1 Protein of unknown function [Actinomyces ruminicola]
MTNVAVPEPGSDNHAGGTGNPAQPRFSYPHPSGSGPVEPFRASTAASELPLLRAYVDETGDRAPYTGRQSLHFGMSAVVVDEDAEREARACLARLRQDFEVPSNRAMSWKRDLKRHDRRLHAASELAKIAGLTVCYVIADKRALYKDSYASNNTTMYNVVAYATLQRILWTAKHHPKGPHRVEARFGHVKNHDHKDTHRYFQMKRDDPGQGKTPFGHLAVLQWVGADEYEMSQVADFYGGFLHAAVTPSKFGEVEGRFLNQIWHQVRNSNGCVKRGGDGTTCSLTLGLQYRPQSQLLKEFDWWNCPDCPAFERENGAQRRP